MYAPIYYLRIGFTNGMGFTLACHGPYSDDRELGNQWEWIAGLPSGEFHFHFGQRQCDAHGSSEQQQSGRQHLRLESQ